jgi:hypothetical protein
VGWAVEVLERLDEGVVVRAARRRAGGGKAPGDYFLSVSGPDALKVIDAPVAITLCLCGWSRIVAREHLLQRGGPLQGLVVPL